MFTKILTLTVSTALLVGIAGCAPTNTTNNMVEQGQVEPLMYEQIIDVRTVEEWNQGRLEGAVRIGIESPDFSAQLEQLDKTGNYFIYCRSGNRAGQAIEIMRELGFTGELVNGGSVAEASTILDANVIK
jgi:phage shock protein E